jgi:hypothetical protein
MREASWFTTFPTANIIGKSIINSPSECIITQRLTSERIMSERINTKCITS